MVEAQIAVGDPVRVLHTKITFTLRPKHGVDFACWVPAFEHFDKAEIVSARKQINRHDRVGINTLIGHVSVVLDDIAGAYIEFHLTIQKARCIAKVEIVTVITIVGYDTFGIYCGG